MIGATYYSDRPTIDVPFRPFERLEVVPNETTPYMTESCAQIYVLGLDRIFYLQQL